MNENKSRHALSYSSILKRRGSQFLLIKRAERYEKKRKYKSSILIKVFTVKKSLSRNYHYERACYKNFFLYDHKMKQNKEKGKDKLQQICMKYKMETDFFFPHSSIRLTCKSGTIYHGFGDHRDL